MRESFPTLMINIVVDYSHDILKKDLLNYCNLWLDCIFLSIIVLNMVHNRYELLVSYIALHNSDSVLFYLVNFILVKQLSSLCLVGSAKDCSAMKVDHLIVFLEQRIEKSLSQIVLGVRISHLYLHKVFFIYYGGKTLV